MPRHGEGILTNPDVLDPIMTGPTTFEKKAKANWLLRILVLFSMGIHLVVFIHITGLYRSKALNYIELTLQDITKPTPRNIPRPRHRPPPPKPHDVEKLKIERRAIPSFKPLNLEPAQVDAPDSLVEPIAMPELPSAPSPGIAQWTPPVIVEETASEFATPGSYLEMVKLKIERHKRYPDQAEERQIEGRATVEFVITLEGEIKDPLVVRSSGHAALDTAAIQAIESAAPFPRPPRSLFKGEIPLMITVVFELM